MKVLVIGSNGFWGRNVRSTLESAGHEVFGASRQGTDEFGGYQVDLTLPDTIAKLLVDTGPDVIINCAGIIDSANDTSLNPVMTTNLLNQIVDSDIQVKSVIIAGSASEYGIVNKQDIPVNENVQLNATSGYGLSKVQETKAALSIGKNHNLPVIIARIFNPIGPNMGSRMLIPRILTQIQEIRDGVRQYIEISRMDSERDCLNVVDAALAVNSIIVHNPKANVYCIGSGEATSNEVLVRAMLENSGLSPLPDIRETLKEPEALVASQADITRIHDEFGWLPTFTLDETIKEIMNVKS